jgi:hypothetical protein
MTYLNLDNRGDGVRLLDSNGKEIDAVAWSGELFPGQSMARLPDGQAWSFGALPSPGQPNRAGDGTVPVTPGAAAPGAPAPAGETPSAAATLEPSHGQAGGPPGSVAQSKLLGLKAQAEFRAVVVAPPGLFNHSIYVADPAGGAVAGIGVNVYLRRGDFPALEEGDLVQVRGRFDSFRGEMELALAAPDLIWRVASGTPLEPLTVRANEIGESLEGRLVTFTGVVTGWQGDSLFLADPEAPEMEPVRVAVRSSLPWKRPYVKKGQLWQVTGIVSQFAKEAPWNGGYRVLPRYEADLVRKSAR